MIVARGAEARARDLAMASAARAGIPVIEGSPDHGAAPLLGAFEASLCASGTASLEAALAGAAPVVAYRLDRLSFAVAKRLVRTPHIALPNVLLGRRAYPELLQDEVTPLELHATLALAGAASFGERVAASLEDWLI